MAYDMAVVNTAYKTARDLKASPKVLLSLFEAGIVESGFRNLNFGADDSVGFLQQRPSQGWASPMDVATATRSFVTKAQANESRYGSSGGLAQSVQRSAYPGKYNAVEREAATLLGKAQGAGGWSMPGGLADPLNDLLRSLGITGGSAAAGAAVAEAAQDGMLGAVESVATGLKGIADGVGLVAKLAELGTRLFLPTNITRAVVGLMGIVFIFIGIAQLGRQVVR